MTEKLEPKTNKKEEEEKEEEKKEEKEERREKRKINSQSIWLYHYSREETTHRRFQKFTKMWN